MSQVSLTGDDTVIIGGQLITDFATGIVADFQFPEDIVKVQRGKNGNVVYALNNQGFVIEGKLRILLGKGNDQFLNAQLKGMKAAFSSTVLLSGIFIKNVGDGLGNITPVTYIMSGGIFKKQPGAQTVAEGNVDQSLVEYDFFFSNNDRTIG